MPSNAPVKNARALLDTSALLAALDAEPGCEDVRARLVAADAGKCELFLSFASLAEVYYITQQDHGSAKAEDVVAVLRGWPLTVIFPDAPLTLAAGRLKAAHAISFADAFIVATARQLDAEFVHKDPEFEPLAGLLRLAPLPYKPRKPGRA